MSNIVLDKAQLRDFLLYLEFPFFSLCVSFKVFMLFFNVDVVLGLECAAHYAEPR